MKMSEVKKSVSFKYSLKAEPWDLKSGTSGLKEEVFKILLFKVNYVGNSV